MPIIHHIHIQKIGTWTEEVAVIILIINWKPNACVRINNGDYSFS